jgi:AhpD family alkylhydroperoxidase
MPRVSEVDLESLPENIRSALEGRRAPGFEGDTWEAVAAHCPEALAHIAGLMKSFGEYGVMPKRYIEIAVVTVSQVNACRHCVGRHSVRLNTLGLGHETIAQILQPDCPGLDEKDRLVRDYAMQVSENSASLRDGLFEELTRYFSEAEIVELTLRIGLAGFFNRFNNAMQVDLDEAHFNAFLSQSGTKDSLPPPA